MTEAATKEPDRACWRVPIKEHPRFEGRWKLNLPREMGSSLVALYRKNHGWRTPADLPFTRIKNQWDPADFAEVIDRRPYEIVLVSLETGQWLTVWAYREDQVSHPEPGYRDGHPLAPAQQGPGGLEEATDYELLSIFYGLVPHGDERGRAVAATCRRVLEERLGQAAAVCSDCGNRWELEDGGKIVPAPCPGCGNPLRLKLRRT